MSSVDSNNGPRRRTKKITMGTEVEVGGEAAGEAAVEVEVEAEENKNEMKKMCL